MDNNIEINLNEQEQTTLEAIKNDLITDIKADIGNLGYDIVHTGYYAGKDIAKLVKKDQQLKVDHDNLSQIVLFYHLIPYQQHYTYSYQ